MHHKEKASTREIMSEYMKRYSEYPPTLQFWEFAKQYSAPGTGEASSKEAIELRKFHDSIDRYQTQNGIDDDYFA